jgi:hypothetical protein
MVNIFAVLEAQKLLNSVDKYFFAQNQILCISLEFWKNGGNASVWARGPGRNAPEASVGMPLISEDQSLFPPEEAGGIFPAPSTEKSAPYDSKRAGLAPGSWKHLALTTLLFSKN